MIKSIGLVLLYFAFQMLGALCAYLGCYGYLFLTKQSVEGLETLVVIPAMFLGIVFMTVFLWKMNFVSKERATWSAVSAKYLLLAVVGYLAFLLVVDFLVSQLQLPDLMKATFDIMQSNWLGILCVALLGPILEELLFRGAVTKILLAQYTPTKAIIISALIFGLFHINPAQVFSATLIGLLLGWMYYKTASLLPCILLHVLNNSLSVYLSLKHPEITELNDFWQGDYKYIVPVVAAIVFVLVFRGMQRLFRSSSMQM
ncbi:CPBP family intramembrane glutamic endopeptidase [Bacteroides sp. 224]|uniref:CPBP family intramembrane glutamic endopeptidase n=1 Tax=Bacteroides sp. 224 TaxID=2302936 RepID=UPI0013D29E61|nr:type II CAAX endopeptidase family protein [Bacteroides sp. 224]NDV63756.1 CPBP family intramembrane metalloprotease [Bacteroides sp. 224]